ncbi:MAG: hypothetical protein IPM68_06645 [Flavobacteriales bacterium]|nr:hypothetical protein [Flavobacteriales bacterium]
MHVLVNNKYVGYGVFIAVMFLPGILWNALDVNTNLVSFGGAPGITYSDMNAYGTALKGWLWFKAYWWAFALLLLLLSMAFWVRGKETRVPQRMRAAVARLKRNRRLVWPALALWVGLGAWSYYNTKVLNEVPNGDAQEEDAAHYERTYKRCSGIHQPHYTDIDFAIDLDPENRGLKSVAKVTVRNKGTSAIDSLHLVLGEGIEQEVEIPGATLVVNDEQVNYRIYRLDRPLAPGADLRFTVTATHVEKGFENSVTVMQINRNGTFFNNMDILPNIGYSDR